jgi:putative isomerase
MTTHLTADITLLRQSIAAACRGMFREPQGNLRHRYVTPGSATYATQLWDWDSWLSDIALQQIVRDGDAGLERDEALSYGRGCILNFLQYTHYGWAPIMIGQDTGDPDQVVPQNPLDHNMHKPVLAQHAAFLVREGGDAEWLREEFPRLQSIANSYTDHRSHRETGLTYWVDDHAIGVDDDPCTYGRPKRSSASIYLNTLLAQELGALAFISRKLGQLEAAATYDRKRQNLAEAINRWCWDERDGFYYSVDIDLEPYAQPEGRWALHMGAPRSWPCLIRRIGVWSGLLPLWAGIASPEQARRVVNGWLKDGGQLACPWGIRSLSPHEAMYDVRATGNPSSWRGPVWGVVNYLAARACLRYGFEAEARTIAERTIRLFARDMRRFGALHEYYEPESGEPLLNRGFQNWNYLALNLAAWLEGRPVVEEFTVLNKTHA